eukprot:GHVQ01031903.1.p1 GENE.GHVQ01031903.1~~GHVQ01031903.1.p1  ORF type:complete len:706 (+),score=114.67 GHVQ01031903.1:686-2803(+)
MPRFHVYDICLCTHHSCLCTMIAASVISSASLTNSAPSSASSSSSSTTIPSLTNILSLSYSSSYSSSSSSTHETTAVTPYNAAHSPSTLIFPIYSTTTNTRQHYHHRRHFTTSNLNPAFPQTSGVCALCPSVSSRHYTITLPHHLPCSAPGLLNKPKSSCCTRYYVCWLSFILFFLPISLVLASSRGPLNQRASTPPPGRPTQPPIEQTSTNSMVLSRSTVSSSKRTRVKLCSLNSPCLPLSFRRPLALYTNVSPPRYKRWYANDEAATNGRLLNVPLTFISTLPLHHNRFPSFSTSSSSTLSAGTAAVLLPNYSLYTSNGFSHSYSPFSSSLPSFSQQSASSSYSSYSTGAPPEPKPRQLRAETNNVSPEFDAKSASTKIGLASYPANHPIEDRMEVRELIVNGVSYLMTAVLDGHGGPEVAEFVRKQLPQRMEEELCRNTKDPSAAVKAAFLSVDSEIEANVKGAFDLGVMKPVTTGACAVSVLITPKTLVVGNVGDCLAVLSQDGTAVPLNIQQNANNPIEQSQLREKHPNENVVSCAHEVVQYRRSLLGGRERIVKYEGCYVKDVLSPTRAFGDFYLKNKSLSPPGIVKLPHSFPYISAVPTVDVYLRTPQDEFAVLGSDGVWDVFSPQEAVDIVKAKLKEAVLNNVGEVAEFAAAGLIQSVKEAVAQRYNITVEKIESIPQGSVRRMVHDDLTVIVVMLQ